MPMPKLLLKRQNKFWFRLDDAEFMKSSDVVLCSMGESSLCGAGDEEAEGKCGTENSTTPAVWAPSFWATSQASATVNRK
jgi:hypothetical protein